MTANTQFPAVSANLWTNQPASRVMTDKGEYLRHYETRFFIREGGECVFQLNDKGVFTELGAEYPQLGKLSPELADVTEQLRLAWLAEQARGDDYVNPYEERQDQRRERYEDRATRARAEGAASQKRANDMLGVIPLGQPILVGHHSERRHRRTLERADNLYRHAFVKCADKAEHYENKAEGVGRGGVSGDDPDAVSKLLAKLQKCIQAQQTMKACNAAIRRNKTPEKQTAALLALGLSEKNASAILEGDFCGRIGFASFNLQNNNAEIKRLQKRISDLKVTKEKATDTEEEYNGFTMKIDGEENRVMFFFEGKPAEEIRAKLKGRAFKWSPSRGAWVRKISPAALYHGECLKQIFIEMMK